MPVFSLPRDPAQWIALGLAIAVALSGERLTRACAARPRAFLSVAAAIAALLSAAYVVVYLRGGPRIVDATSYWLEARGIAAGKLAWPAGEPETSVLGRFLVRGAEPGTVGVIFPPGYPAVLAVAFLAGAPMALGPVLAGALVALTWVVARDVGAELAEDGAGEADAPGVVAVTAVLLSVVCGALRYHTADTMSHGVSAVCFAGAIAAATRAVRVDRASARWAVACGACVGWLAATRPASALAAACTVAIVAAPALRARRDKTPLALAFGAGLLPGLALLVAHRMATTGDPWTSAQSAYYAVSDGPAGCFRFGFGDGIGCLGEHRDFVEARLRDGFGILAAVGTTARRLKMHLVDPANLEPLALLVVGGAAIGWRRSKTARALALGVALQMAAYAPFYFDGNYPGGGARFFADVLPLEHVLVAVAAWKLAARWGRGPVAVVGLSLAGFAVRAGFDHAALRDREGGAPMFDRARARAAGVERGLVFVSTDHGWSLGADPTSRDPVRVVRRRGDAIDWMTWDAAGRPPAFAQTFVWDGDAGVGRERFVTLELGASMPPIVEGESLWPPNAVDGAWSWPEHAAGTCASGGRWLALHGKGTVTVSFPTRWVSGRAMRPTLALRNAAARVELVVDGQLQGAADLEHTGDIACLEPAQSFVIPQDSRQALLRIAMGAGPGAVVALDRLSFLAQDETR